MEEYKALSAPDPPKYIEADIASVETTRGASGATYGLRSTFSDMTLL